MQQQGLFGLAKKVLFSRIGVTGMILAGVYWGYAHAPLLQRVEYNTTRKNVRVSPAFFPDPAGISVETTINSSGMQEVYLVHKESQKKLALGKDLLPESTQLLDALIQRHGTPEQRTSEDAALFTKTQQLQQALYQNKTETK